MSKTRKEKMIEELERLIDELEEKLINTPEKMSEREYREIIENLKHARKTIEIINKM